MKTYRFSDEQKEEIFDALASERCEYGYFNMELMLQDSTIVIIKGWLEVDGYRDTDYFDGDGSWVETYRSSGIDDITVFVAHEDESEEMTVENSFKIECECLLEAV